MTYVIKKIAEYGQQYKKNYLVWNKENIISDSYAALDSLFTRSFYRGRPDTLSKIYYAAASAALSEYHPKIKRNFNKTELDKLLKSKGVNNEFDRKMVISSVSFIFDKKIAAYGNNIALYVSSKIKEGKTSEAFDLLKEIHGIADKLSALYIRDVIFLYDLENKLSPADFIYCQPIDTWVRQVAKKIDLIQSDKLKNTDIAQLIISACEKAKISPLLFNAGAWMVGANSFDLLIDSLRLFKDGS